MFTTDLYSLIAGAGEVFVGGKKMVGYWFEDEGSDENSMINIETEGDQMYCFDNDAEITYGEDTDDGAWVDEVHSGKQMYLTAYNVERRPLRAS